MKMPVGDRKIAIPMNVTLKGYIDFSDFSERNVRKEAEYCFAAALLFTLSAVPSII